MKGSRLTPAAVRAPALRFVDDTHVRSGGRTLLAFAGCNYLALAWHPALGNAISKAAGRGPIQTGASRRTTGEHPTYLKTERTIAKFFGTEAAAFTATGYLASIAAAQSLREEITCVLLDAGAHACVKDGAQLTGQRVIEFPNCDWTALKKALGKLSKGERPLIATDGTFATRGGLAPLDQYLRLLPKSGFLLVDDAHGAGAVGPGGRGAAAHFGIRDPRLILSVTFAKAFAVAGGAVLGTGEIIERVRAKAGAYIGSTAQPLAVVSAVETAVRLVSRSPKRVRQLQTSAAHLASLLKGLPEVLCDTRSPILAVHPANPDRAERLRLTLLKGGIFPSWIQYPGGPGGGFFRFAVNAAHTEDELTRLASAIRSVLAGPT